LIHAFVKSCKLRLLFYCTAFPERGELLAEAKNGGITELDREGGRGENTEILF
jgi:hypothetical protein